MNQASCHASLTVIQNESHPWQTTAST